MRSKLTLKLEDLSVDSFATSPAEQARGTVLGEQCTCYTRCPEDPTCGGQASCVNTCAGTCGDTCPETCVYTCVDLTCAAWCGNTGQTYCDCGATCGQTDCGPYFCCA
ncbi:MAG TPA: hypothetical protein VEQ60_07255 [Longimicrobium sp.]|nr:hypothetical protein [Longimicrobium sp.]